MRQVAWNYRGFAVALLMTLGFCLIAKSSPAPQSVVGSADKQGVNTPAHTCSYRQVVEARITRDGKYLATLTIDDLFMGDTPYAIPPPRLARDRVHIYKLFNLTNGHIVHSCRFDEKIWPVAITHDGSSALLFNKSTSLTKLNLVTGENIVINKQPNWSGRPFLQQDDTNILSWDFIHGTATRSVLTRQTIKDQNPIAHITLPSNHLPALSDDGALAIALTGNFTKGDDRLYANGVFQVIDTHSGKVLSSFQGFKDKMIYDPLVNRMAISPDHNYFAIVATECTSNLWKVGVWAISSGKLLHTFTFSKGYLNAVRFSPDSTKLAFTAGTVVGKGRDIKREETVTLWDITHGKQITALKPIGEECIFLFTPDSKRIVTTGTIFHRKTKIELTPGPIQVWDIAANGKMISSFTE